MDGTEQVPGLKVETLDMDVVDVGDRALDVGQALLPSINVAFGLFSNLLHSPPNRKSSKLSGKPFTGNILARIIHLELNKTSYLDMI